MASTLLNKMNFLFVVLFVAVIVVANAKKCPDGTLLINGICVLSAPEGRIQTRSISRNFSLKDVTCPAGTRRLSKDGERLQCEDCPPGTYNPFPGSIICIDCRYHTSRRATRCEPNQTPIDCFPGQYYDREIGECRQCPYNLCSMGSGALGCFRRMPGEGCPKGLLPP